MTDPATARLTHLGGPTLLLEVAGWRILTDPTFDPPGRRYRFGWGTSSTKVSAPSMAVTDVGAVDAILLTHDQHADNLDDAGRLVLAQAPMLMLHFGSGICSQIRWRTGSIFITTRPATIIRSHCRGLNRMTSAPKRARSNRLAPTAISSIPQQAVANGIGQSECLRHQFTT